MQNVVLTVHLILALLLTGVVLLQRSEGGGLGLGGGGGGGAGGVMSGRQAANALTRLTWIFGIALFVTSLTLTVIAARQSSTGSVMDQLGANAPGTEAPSNLPTLPTYVPPPGTGQPVTPPAPDAPAAAGEAATGDAAVAPPAAEVTEETPAAEAPAAEIEVPAASAPAEPVEPAAEAAAPVDADATSAPVTAPAN